MSTYCLWMTCQFLCKLQQSLQQTFLLLVITKCSHNIFNTMSVSLEVTQIKRKQSCDAELKFFPQFFPLKDLFWKTVGKHIKQKWLADQEATVLKIAGVKCQLSCLLCILTFWGKCGASHRIRLYLLRQQGRTHICILKQKVTMLSFHGRLKLHTIVQVVFNADNLPKLLWNSWVTKCQNSASH